MAAEYEIVIGPGGTVESTLLTEGTNQNVACEQIVRLMNSLGNVSSHDELQGVPQPVEQGIWMPGSDK